MPTICPVCGAKHDQFIEIIEENITFRKDTNESFVVVGNGAAGFYAVDAIRKRNKTCKIYMISNEQELTYNNGYINELNSKGMNCCIYRCNYGVYHNYKLSACFILHYIYCYYAFSL